MRARSSRRAARRRERRALELLVPAMDELAPGRHGAAVPRRAHNLATALGGRAPVRPAERAVPRADVHMLLQLSGGEAATDVAQRYLLSERGRRDRASAVLGSLHAERPLELAPYLFEQGLVPPPRVYRRRRLALMVTDLEGFTPLVERLGDAHAQQLIREHNAILRAHIRDHSGLEITHTGDGLIALFATAAESVGCAIAIERELAARNLRAEQPLHVRVGLHVGEPLLEEGRLFGASVIAAVRICAACDAGDILASALVETSLSPLQVPLYSPQHPQAQGLQRRDRAVRRQLAIEGATHADPSGSICKTRIFERFEQALNTASMTELAAYRTALREGIPLGDLLLAQWRSGHSLSVSRADQKHLLNHAFNRNGQGWWGADVEAIAGEGVAQAITRMLFTADGAPRTQAKRIDCWWMLPSTHHFSNVITESAQQITYLWVLRPRAISARSTRLPAARAGRGHARAPAQLQFVVPDNFTRKENCWVVSASRWSLTHGVDAAGKPRACAEVIPLLASQRGVVTVTRPFCEAFRDRFPQPNAASLRRLRRRAARRVGRRRFDSSLQAAGRRPRRASHRQASSTGVRCGRAAARRRCTGSRCRRTTTMMGTPTMGCARAR